jgi:hypothetical protein
VVSFFNVDFPVRKILERVQAPLLLRSSYELLGDISLVEAIVGSIDSFLARLSLGEGLLLCLH